MKHPKFLLLLLCLSMCSTALFSQKDVSVEIMKANENFMTLFNAGDAEAFITVYTDDARLLPPNMPVVTGKDALREFWGGMMSAGIKPVLKTTSADGYGKTAIEEGIVEIWAGDMKVDDVKYVVVWKKIKGEWKMHQDIWNSNNPPAGS